MRLSDNRCNSSTCRHLRTRVRKNHDRISNRVESQLWLGWRGIIACRIEIEQDSLGAHNRVPGGERPDGPSGITPIPRAIVIYGRAWILHVKVYD